MGKCSICGNKIEYNQYKVIDEKVYCPKCAKKVEEKIYPKAKEYEMNDEAEDTLEVDTVGTGASVKYADPPKEIKPRKKYKKRKVKKEE